MRRADSTGFLACRCPRPAGLIARYFLWVKFRPQGRVKAGGYCQRRVKRTCTKHYSKVWFNTPDLCSGSNNATFTKIWY